MICLRRLPEEEIRELAGSLGYETRGEFEAAIAALPSAKPQPPETSADPSPTTADDESPAGQSPDR